MTLQERLRKFADSNNYDVYIELMPQAADRIDELEKGPNLLNAAWLQGEFSELQAKVEILLNEHAERGVRIDELEATIRKMAMDSLSVEGQWSDKVDELEKRLEIKPDYKWDGIACRDITINLQDEQIASLHIQLEAKQARIEELEKHQVTESANQMLNGWKEDQECRNASS